MPLIDKLPDFIAINMARLNEQELELKNLLSEGHKLVRWNMTPAQVGWNEYRIIMGKTYKLLDAYNGRFKNYFTGSLNDLKEKGRDILGYSTYPTEL